VNLTIPVFQDDNETFNAVNARLSPHFRKASGARLRKILPNTFNVKYVDRTVGGVRIRVKHYICYAEGEQGYRGTVSGHLLRYDLSPAENLCRVWIMDDPRKLDTTRSWRPLWSPYQQVTSKRIFVLCVCWAYVWNREIKLSSNPVSNKRQQSNTRIASKWH